jgi:hypothetical protein
MVRWSFTLVFVFAIRFFFAQQSCPLVNVEGQVVDTTSNQRFFNMLVINRSSNQGLLGNPNGTFQISAHEGDTITLSVSGYSLVNFKVVGYNCKQHKTIVLHLIRFESNEVVVKPIKSLEEIKKEREQLVLKMPEKLKGVDAFVSPITALYQRFSKIERTKAKVAELTHQDNVNKVLKELLRTYVSYDVVDLDESEFVDFIHFMNISEDFLRNSNDYQLIMLIKEKLKQYRSLNDYYFQKEKE